MALRKGHADLSASEHTRMRICRARAYAYRICISSAKALEALDASRRVGARLAGPARCRVDGPRPRRDADTRA